MLARAVPFFALGALGALVAASGGCEALVNGEVPPYSTPAPIDQPDVFVDDVPDVAAPVLCDEKATANTCGSGRYCRAGVCTDCSKPGDDPCDYFDNDCNGKVDDGKLSDADGDGYSWCGRRDAVNQKLVLVDCIDDDPAVHPGAKEICNDKDDDCDGVKDNPDQVCPAGQTCVPRDGTCIATTQACSSTSCPPGQVCDAQTQKCVTPAGAGVGSPCTADRECLSGICADATTIPGAANLCTTPCCRSDQCPDGFVCYGPGGGGKYCVRPDVAQRGVLGTVAGGAACSASSQCRSGLCVSGHCADTCCGDADCSAGSVCAFTTIAGHQLFACVSAVGRGRGKTSTYDSCSANNDCASGVCGDLGWPLGASCAATCCKASDCPIFNSGGTEQIACTYGRTSTTGDYSAACLKQSGNSSPAAAKIGDACKTDSDCASDRCMNGKCTDVCCKDADCAAGDGGKGWVCRPTPFSNGKALFCVAPTN